MTSEAPPTEGQPPPKTPATPARHSRTPENAGNSNLEKRLESLRSEITLTLKNTEWPTESEVASEALLTTIVASPNIPTNIASMTQEVPKLVEQYAQTLEDVRLRLKDASSKSEMKRWKLLQRIKSLASNRPSKCTLLFQTCQDDVSKALNSLNERLDYERAKVSLPESQLHPIVQLSIQEPSAGTAEHAIASDDPAPNSLLLKEPPSNTPKPRKDRGPISDEALTIARKTFKGVEIASGAIPVVGNYVGATAKTMDRNDDLAIDLGEHTSKLIGLLETFNKKSRRDERDIASRIKDVHEELGQIKAKVEEWSSLGGFKKAWSARDHAEVLKEYQGKIQTVREEIQLLVSLDSRNIVIELENIELRKERRRLLKCLGDGQNGARGNTLQDIICLPGTRLEILKRVDNWIRDTSTSNPALWICGMAGRGKSTVASTVVHNWRGRASCAIFHFRRGQSTLNSRVVCVLARQLGSGLVPEVRDAILESMRENEDIADPHRRLDEQFETLFVTPFATLKSQNYPILIVVDALDECDNPKDAVDFVKLIHQHSASFPTNVKFLLTCRPEAALTRNLEPKGWLKEDLDLTPGTNDDIDRFIQHGCAQIRNEHDLSEGWPSAGDIKKLVQMSQGLFQWARTAMTYLGDGSPADRLRELVQRPASWSGLDDLYHQILSKAFHSVRLDPVRRDLLHRVLGALALAPYPISLEIVASLNDGNQMFGGAKQEDIIQFLRKDILANLNSLLSIPLSPAEPMHLMHTSVRDLLISKDRCAQQLYYIDLIPCHRQLATTCFDLMLEHLKENICNLSDVSKPSSEVQKVMEREVSTAVRYCCRGWSTHLTEGVPWPKLGESVNTPDLAQFESFSKAKLMGWLEVMSLVGATTEAISAARRIHQWLLQRPIDVPRHDPLTALWDDVQRFITTFLEPISFGPLHIYISALPHCPTETEIWNLYGKHARIRITHGHQMSRWPSNLWTRSLNAEVTTVDFSPDGWMLAVGSSDNKIRILDTPTGTALGEPLTGHSDIVWSVRFSPQGKVLASGCGDSKIRLWDSQDRVLVGQPLTGHRDWVRSVCFSSDGKLLASGSADGTVQLWNTEIGEVVGKPLKGHSLQVLSVCFSPDGTLLASGSADNTIRFWDPLAGVPAGEPLKAHHHNVRSVHFSPHGNLLASGSEDKTICLWATDTKTLVRDPLIGHTGGVYSVCFSPDGKILISGSDDMTIRLWNTETGAALGEPLTGHSATVWSVCFSPDGKLLASGSFDRTVRLWDPQAGAAVAGSLITHRAKVKSVCFSPDGKRVASGSDDKSIRLWDPQTGAAVGDPLTGHTREVSSVCFSLDGKLLASGSNDKTIRLWDAQTGVAVGQPLTGHGHWVNSVCFSPDGKLLASGSYDTTVRLWDPMTGVQVGEPLTGHGDYVMSVCFSPDGKYLASGSNDSTIRLWDPQTGAAVGEPLKEHSRPVISVSFSSDGSLLLARCEDGSLATWDVNTRQRYDTPHSHTLYTNPHFQDHWITFGSSRFLWLPPQYWNSGIKGVSLFSGHLAAIQNGSLSILDVSQVLGTLNNQL